MDYSNRGGYLEIILGPMFSGKTTRLLEIYHRRYNKDTNNIKVINYMEDKRYHDSMLSTHDKNMIPCIFANKISDVCNSTELSTIDVILINEGQFFDDLYDSTLELVEKYNKEVYICGLDGDFKRLKFGSILDLIPICDKVIKLQANCVRCNRLAIFSKRLTDEESQVVIGTSNYAPMCRNCYNL